MSLVIAILGAMCVAVLIITLWPLFLSLGLSFLFYAAFGYGLGFYGVGLFLWGAAFIICMSAMGAFA